MTLMLTEEEQAMRRGESGEAAKWGVEFQISVGEFFGARRLLPIRSAHVMCDAEAIGEPGVRLLERWAEHGARVKVPTTTDPRSVDFQFAEALGQEESLVSQETRIVEAMSEMGVLTCNTCVNYQVVDPPRFGETLGWGDTGAVIYANSVAGARSNFEGGPSALAAALTGRVAEYGFHLDERRRGTVVVKVDTDLDDSSDWGALGAVVGRKFPGYWEVPVLVLPGGDPGPDDLKQLGASLASFGSHAMFHFVEVTPQAPTESAALGGRDPHDTLTVTEADLDAVYESYQPDKHEADLVVFGTPQLSLFELAELTERVSGVELGTRVIMTTSPQVWATAKQLGHVDRLQETGAMVLGGVCFYVMAARQLAQSNGFHTIVTNSAKLANIIEGYGYNPVFRSTDQCIEIATSGRLAR